MSTLVLQRQIYGRLSHEEVAHGHDVQHQQ